MASVQRTTIWSDNQVLTAAALNGEFNNLLNALNIVNADISAGAAIAYSKLNLTGDIVNTDISASAAIAASKISFGGSNGNYLQSNGSGGLNYVGVTINRAFGLASPGLQIVANDVSWNPIAPEGMTAVKIWAHAKTAPTTSGLTVQVYNITQAHVVASVTISATTTDANSTSMTNASITAGDVLRLDVTAIGSGTAGSDVSVVLETTQP